MKISFLILIFPDDHTRIQLENDLDEDYINASQIVSQSVRRSSEHVCPFRLIPIQNVDTLQHKDRC